MKTQILFLTLFVCCISCKNENFEVEKAEFKALQKDEINKLVITNLFLNNSTNLQPKKDEIIKETPYNDNGRPFGISQRDWDEKKLKKLNLELKNKINSIEEEDFKSWMIEADKQAVKEKSIRRNYLLKTDRIGFKNILIVNNNTKETIENAILTTLIVYEFNNKSYTFIKEYPILKKNEIWKTNEVKNIKVDNILSYSYNFNDKIFKVHKPKQIFTEVYLKAKNSVGFVNFTKGAINSDIDTSNGYNQIYRNNNYINAFGELKARTLTDVEKKTLGEKIHQENLTELVED